MKIGMAEESLDAWIGRWKEKLDGEYEDNHDDLIDLLRRKANRMEAMVHCDYDDGMDDIEIEGFLARIRSE